MPFVLLAVLVAALVFAWVFTRHRQVSHEPAKRLSIAVTDGIALVTLPATYEVEDMWGLWEFMQGKEAAVTRTRVHSLVFDCSQWSGSNVVGLEMLMWQAESDWTGDTIFCQLSPEMKSVLDTLLKGETVRTSLYFATLEEGLAYARAKQTRRA